jgi:hypothetical protein
VVAYFVWLVLVYDSCGEPPNDPTHEVIEDEISSPRIKRKKKKR